MSGVDHLQQLLGLPAVTFLPDSPTPLPAAEAVAWRISVEPFEDDEPWDERFEAFLKAVDPGRVRALIIGQWCETTDSDSSFPINLVIAAADRFTALEAIFVGDLAFEESEISWIEQSNVTGLLSTFPGLVEFGVRGGQGLRFPPVRHDRLRSLVFESGGLPAAVVRGVAESELPSLTRLDLWLGVSEYGGDCEIADLAPLLSGTCLPGLRHLGLRNSEIQNEIAAAVASAPVVARLHTLDLSNGTLGDEGAAALLEGQPLTHLERLDLHHHFLSEEMEQRVAGALEPHGVRVDLSDRLVPWDNRGAEGRYTAVAE